MKERGGMKGEGDKGKEKGEKGKEGKRNGGEKGNGRILCNCDLSLAPAG